MIDEVISNFDWKRMIKIMKDAKLKFLFNEKVSTKD